MTLAKYRKCLKSPRTKASNGRKKMAPQRINNHTVTLIITQVTLSLSLYASLLFTSHWCLDFIVYCIFISWIFITILQTAILAHVCLFILMTKTSASQSPFRNSDKECRTMLPSRARSPPREDKSLYEVRVSDTIYHEDMHHIEGIVHIWC